MKSFIVVTITILFELIGFIFGYYFLRGASQNLLGTSLSLAAGFMTYISVEELTPAAQIKQNLKEGVFSLKYLLTLKGKAIIANSEDLIRTFFYKEGSLPCSDKKNSSGRWINNIIIEYLHLQTFEDWKIPCKGQGEK